MSAVTSSFIHHHLVPEAERPWPGSGSGPRGVNWPDTMTLFAGGVKIHSAIDGNLPRDRIFFFIADGDLSAVVIQQQEEVVVVED